MSTVRDYPEQGLSVVEATITDLRDAYTVPAHESNVPNLRQANCDGGEWYGGIKTLGEATALLDTGWRDGAERLAKVASELSPPVARTRRRTVQWRDEGDDLHVDRAMAGDWDAAWRSSRRTWSANPGNVHLYTRFGGNCMANADQLFWQGAACIVIADLLEASGYSVRIDAAFSVSDQPSGKGGWHTTQITVKDAGEPLRIDAAASVLCHAGVFRTHGFRTMLQHPHNLGSTLGYPPREAWPEALVERLKAAGEWTEGVIAIDHVATRDQCLAQIKKVIDSLNG